jgi:maleate isomerase
MRDELTRVASHRPLPGWIEDTDFGWRGRIGMIYPSIGRTPEHEWWRLAPRGVTLHITRVLLRATSMEELNRIGGFAEDAARLLATAKPDVICFACTTGTMVRGMEYDRQLTGRISEATGIPATSMAQGVIEGLRALGAKKLAVATAYVDEINAHERQFLLDNGFEVELIEGLQLTDSIRISEVSPEEVYRFARDVYRRSGSADAILISCGSLRTLEIVSELESDTGKPVVSSNIAQMWIALRMLGIGEPVLGVGRLMQVCRPGD